MLSDYLIKNGIEYLENEPMFRHTTYKVGGKAKIFALPDSEEKLILTVQAAKEHGVRYYVVGRCSNLIFSDEGFDGIIIATEKLNSIKADGNKITASCGASFTKLASVAADNSLSGLEFAYGIPGFVGGAVFMNAGAYSGEVSGILASSTFYDSNSAKINVISSDEHKFGYRYSIYREHPEWIILSAEFSLRNGDQKDIRTTMDSYMSSRREKQPLEYPSAGSVFKRPEGYFAGKLIQDAGLKGFRIGGAEVSEKHSGFIINAGGATEHDITSLIEHIQNTVYDKFGVMLQCEQITVR